MQSADLVDELETRSRRVRAKAAGGWLPLVLTGLALLGAFPAYAGLLDYVPWWGWESTASSDGHLFMHGSIAQLADGSRPVALYWLLVVPVLYAATVIWFTVRSRRTGLRQS